MDNALKISADSILTPDAEAFLSEWFNGSEYVTAHTSGSTGAPKEIRLLKSDMRISARTTNRFFGIDSDSTLFLPLSPSYIAGRMHIVRAVEAGCRIIVEKPSSAPLQSCPSAGRIDIIPVVPSQIPGLLQSPYITQVRNIIIGGAPLDPALEQRVIDSGVSAWATFGMTETCSHVALRRLGDTAFRALPGIEFSTDERGCLIVTSDSMSFGSLVTNDIVRLFNPGAFEWLGRADNVINSGGVKLHPEEIEKTIAPMLTVGTTFYITSRPSEKWGEEAILVTESSCPISDDFLHVLKGVLPAHSVPKAIVRLDEIPRTASGKIIRQKFGLNCK